MPREDAKEDKEFTEQESNVQIVTQDQLANFKLDTIIDTQKLILKNQALILKLAKE